ncbi:MAG TPA: ABC-type transport auxiliary lipoprotein family protein [Kofleriaceae bacterium]|nr:ABC-type transport auxiliary lipoprotein family protein [Kofleriaceae bacterium]
MTRARLAALAPLAALALAAACGARPPELRYYQIAVPGDPRRPPAGAPVVAVEELEVDDAYDDDRIVYRTSPYRLDYYHYHRWSARPGQLLARALESALERTGRFTAVTDEDAGAAGAVLGGRVTAIEEVDLSERQWVARLALELHLRDAASGEVLWSGEVEETEPLTDRSPEGLARAVSRAVARVARRIARPVARAAAGGDRERAEAGGLDD